MRDPVYMLNSIWYFQKFFFSCSHKYVVINHCDFNLYSLMTNEVQDLFPVLAIHIILFSEMSFAHFLIGLLVFTVIYSRLIRYMVYK